MGKIKEYPSYYNSQKSWPLEIPENWKLYRLKHVFEITKRIVGELGHDVLSITQKGIKVKDTESGAGQLSMDYSKYQQVDKGDFAMNHMDLLTGFVDISKYEGVVSPDYRVFKLTHNESDSNYLLYILQLCYTQKIFFGHGKGVSMLGRWRLPSENFKNFIIPIPPKDEQTAIAAFLGYKLIKIDRFIRKKKQLIKLLNEQKAAIINHAVTKGINPKVKMKPSGIEWLGDIPEHWEVMRLKYLAKICNGSDCDKKEVGAYPVFGSGGVFGRTDSILYDKVSVLLGRKGTIDRPQFVNEPFWTVDTAFYTKIKEEIVNPLFLYFLCCNIHFGFYSSKTALPSMTQTSLYCVKFTVPSKVEQKAIVEYIESESSKRNAAIYTIEKEISLTQEYRTALIAEAVTGKIDVRDFVIPEEKEEEIYEELEEELNIVAENETEYEIVEEN